MSAGLKAREIWWEKEAKKNEAELFEELRNLKHEMKSLRHELGIFSKEELEVEAFCFAMNKIMRSLLQHI